MVSAQELADYNAKFEAGATFGAAALTNFPFDLVLRRGDLVPEFSLPGPTGETTSLLETLAGGPVVLTFYRGVWCPYCNIQLAAYERALPDIVEAGGRLIAVPPQKPDGSLSMIEKIALRSMSIATREPADAVANALIEGIRESAFEVIRGGEARAKMIAANRDNLASIDERFLSMKPALEEAVSGHSAL